MNWYFIFLYFLIFSDLQGQRIVVGEDPCSGKLYIKSRYYEKYPYDTYKEFVTHFVQDTQVDQYLRFNDSSLLQINRLFCYPNMLVFEDTVEHQTFDIRISIGRDSIRYNKSMEDDIGDTEVERLNMDIRENYLGIPDVIGSIAYFSRIQTISLKHNSVDIPVDSALFLSLLSPNTCFNWWGVDPMSVYYDKELNSIYIYITGFMPGYLMNNQSLYLDEASYMAKIVVDLNSKKNYLISMRGHFMEYYGWLSCDKFWPF